MKLHEYDTRAGKIPAPERLAVPGGWIYISIAGKSCAVYVPDPDAEHCRPPVLDAENSPAEVARAVAVEGATWALGTSSMRLMRHGQELGDAWRSGWSAPGNGCRWGYDTECLKASALALARHCGAWVGED